MNKMFAIALLELIAFCCHVQSKPDDSVLLAETRTRVGNYPDNVSSKPVSLRALRITD
jgi:hypothetical protein